MVMAADLPPASWTPDPAITAELASRPALLEEKLESAMRKLVKDPQKLEINVASFTDAETALGHLRQVHVVVERGEIDGLVLNHADILFEDVQLDTTKLVRDDKIETKQVGNINMDVVIKEADLNTFLKAKAAKIKVDNPRVQLTPGRLELEGSTRYSFMKVNFSATGKFNVHDSKEIWFHPNKMKMNSMSMPRAFIGTIVKRINPVLNLEKFPFRLNLKEIRIDQGEMHFSSFRKGE
jgi:hypothetical protein